MTCRRDRFSHTLGLLFGARAIDDLPSTLAYMKRIAARPAYRKAMRVAGPEAPAPGNPG